MGLLATFKPRFFPTAGLGRGLQVGGTVGGMMTRDRGQMGPIGGKDSTYWLVMEAWVAGWGKLVVQMV